MLQIIRFLLGYVVFEGICPSPEHFMNLLAQRGLNTWNVRSSKNKLTGCIKASDYKYIKPIVYKSHSKIKIKEKHGLAFKLRPYKNRRGLLVGAVIFIAVLKIFSLFIWSIHINESTQIPQSEIYAALSDLGVYPGIKSSSIDSQVVEQQLMNKLTDIAWVAININGSVINVEIKDRIKPPEISIPGANSNLVASRPGQITKLEIYSGIAMVKPNDVVITDQILVSGIFEDDLGGINLSQSVGKVYASTLRELKQEVPMNKEVLIQNAPTINRKRINFFGLNIPVSLTSAPDSDYQLDTQTFQAELFGTKLPISLLAESFTPVTRTSTVLTCDQSQAIAEEKLKTQEQNTFTDCTILNKTVKYQIEGDTYILTANYLCEENIAVEKPLDVQIQPSEQKAPET